MKILVFGHGQLANFLKDYSADVVFSTVDITDRIAVEKELGASGVQAVINTTAKTGVDWCQKNPEETFRVNTLAPYNLCADCHQRNIFYCQISTGCIYYEPTGLRPVDEEERPNPKSFYSFTKAWVEELLAGQQNVLILRPRLFISAKPSPKNLISRWLKMNHFLTNLNSRTIIEDAVPIILKMVQRKITGTFNLVNEGSNSDYECALILRKIIDTNLVVEKTNIEELNRRLKVPRVSVVLSTNKLKNLGLALPNFQKSFLKTAKEYKKNLYRDQT